MKAALNLFANAGLNQIWSYRSLSLPCPKHRNEKAPQGMRGAVGFGKVR
jgi:hypothetical protein